MSHIEKALDFTQDEREGKKTTLFELCTVHKHGLGGYKIFHDPPIGTYPGFWFPRLESLSQATPSPPRPPNKVEGFQAFLFLTMYKRKGQLTRCLVMFSPVIFS